MGQGPRSRLSRKYALALALGLHDKPVDVAAKVGASFSCENIVVGTRAVPSDLKSHFRPAHPAALPPQPLTGGGHFWGGRTAQRHGPSAQVAVGCLVRPCRRAFDGPRGVCFCGSGWVGTCRRRGRVSARAGSPACASVCALGAHRVWLARPVWVTRVRPSSPSFLSYRAFCRLPSWRPCPCSTSIRQLRTPSLTFQQG